MNERHAASSLKLMKDQDHNCKTSFSAVVCTTGRMPSVLHCLQSILEIENGPSELILVDQCLNNHVELAIQPLLQDPRFHYLHITARNKGAALNAGIAVAAGDIVAITDDDCIVTPDWIKAYQEIFDRNADIAVCFGRVDAAPHNTEQGYVPHNLISTDRVFSTVSSMRKSRGIGANMAIRRRIVQQIGGFDLLLSPGGLFYASEDRDIMLRCLMSGILIYECAESVVVHDGFRSWEQGRDHTYKDWVGIGAMCAKFLKYQWWKTLPLIAYLFFTYAFLPFLVATLLGRNPKGWLRIRAFFSGLRRGWHEPVDKETMMYQPENKAAAEESIMKKVMAL